MAQGAKLALRMAPGLGRRLCLENEAEFSEQSARKATRQISADRIKINSPSGYCKTLLALNSQKCVNFSFVYVCAAEFVAVCARGARRGGGPRAGRRATACRERSG
jgi:hypothetical protein